MTLNIPFSGRIYFTGAPESGLEELAARIHSIMEIVCNGKIPYFDFTFFINPASVFLGNDLRRAREMLLVADTLLGRDGPFGEEQNFYLLRGPADFIAFATMQGISIPDELKETCSHVAKKIQLVVFQLPDRERWRMRGFDERAVSWLEKYTWTLLETLRFRGLRLEQFRVIPPNRGDMEGYIMEACWRIFGVAFNPVMPSEWVKPRASLLRSYQTQARDIFEMNDRGLIDGQHKL